MPSEVAPPLLSARAGWGRCELSEAGCAGWGSLHWLDVPNTTVARGELPSDTGERVEREGGRERKRDGGFSRKGHNCSGRATPACGRLCALQPGGVWWRVRLVQRLLPRGPWSSQGIWRLRAAKQYEEVVWDCGCLWQSKEDYLDFSLLHGVR